MVLSSEQINTFQTQGAVVLPGAFTGWVDELRQGVAENLKAPGIFSTDSAGQGEGGRFFDDYCNWERIPAYYRFATESSCASIASHAMQSDARLFHEHLVLKEAGTAKATPWHHDLTYYCVDGMQTASIWIALDPVPLENAVTFVAGSHRDGNNYFPRKFVDARNYDYPSDDYVDVPDIDSHRDAYSLLAWECEPGDAVLFDFRTLHGTNASVLKGPRRAIAWRWLGEDVRFCRRPGVTSPPYPELNLKTDDPLPEELFPVIQRLA